MPVFNLEACAPRTLASVLSQSPLPDEVLVVDDGSTDRTLERLSEAAQSAPSGLVRLLPGSHVGPGACRNRGIREAKGDWVAFLDGDDLWLPGKMAKLRAAIADHPEAGIIAHDEVEVALDGSERHKPLHRYWDESRALLPQLYRGCFFSTSCVAVRADGLREAGLFDEALGAAQDYDLWLRLARHHNAHFIREPLSRYLLRQGNISSNVPLRYQCLRQIAFRHAPYVAPLIGSLATRRLRFRLLLSIQKELVALWARTADFGELVARGPSMLADLAAALFGPLEQP